MLGSEVLPVPQDFLVFDGEAGSLRSFVVGLRVSKSLVIKFAIEARLALTHISPDVNI